MIHLVDPLAEQIGGDHYKGMAIQPIEYAEANKLTPSEFGILKYLSRHRRKGGAEDVKKIIHFAELLLKFEYGEVLAPRIANTSATPGDTEVSDDTSSSGDIPAYTAESVSSSSSSTYSSDNYEDPRSNSTNGYHSPPCPICNDPNCPNGHPQPSAEDDAKREVFHKIFKALVKNMLHQRYSDKLPPWYVSPEFPEGYMLLGWEYHQPEHVAGTTRCLEAVVSEYRRPDGTSFSIAGVTAVKSGYPIKYMPPSSSEISMYFNSDRGSFRPSNSYTPNVPHIVWYDNV